MPYSPELQCPYTYNSNGTITSVDWAKNQIELNSSVWNCLSNERALIHVSIFRWVLFLNYMLLIFLGGSKDCNLSAVSKKKKGKIDGNLCWKVIGYFNLK